MEIAAARKDLLKLREIPQGDQVDGRTPVLYDGLDLADPRSDETIEVLNKEHTVPLILQTVNLH